MLLQQQPDRVKQVWFKGSHIDIGSGYADSRLSDITLHWMERGNRRRPTVLRYRILNTLDLLLDPRSRRYYPDSWRRLDASDDQKVYLSSAVDPGGAYHPPNVERWEQKLLGEGRTVPTERMDIGKRPSRLSICLTRPHHTRHGNLAKHALTCIYFDATAASR
ncbi:hypothetical protein HPY32_28615 [Nocardia terpenica]|nr:hypothetical protein [Nocardia terpenica]